MDCLLTWIESDLSCNGSCHWVSVELLLSIGVNLLLLLLLHDEVLLVVLLQLLGGHLHGWVHHLHAEYWDWLLLLVLVDNLLLLAVFVSVLVL